VATAIASFAGRPAGRPDRSELAAERVDTTQPFLRRQLAIALGAAGSDLLGLADCSSMA
jgi:hypothetical protein